MNQLYLSFQETMVTPLSQTTSFFCQTIYLSRNIKEHSYKHILHSRFSGVFVPPQIRTKSGRRYIHQKQSKTLVLTNLIL